MNTQLPLDSRLDPRIFARSLYFQGWKISAIARHLNVKPGTVHSWKVRDSWEDGDPIVRVNSSIEARVNQLIMLPEKSERDFRELTQLYGLLERGQKHSSRKREEGKQTSDPNWRAGKKRGAQIKPEKNYFSDEAKKRLNEIFFETMFKYQKDLWDNRHHRIRDILKSRQIGITYYFGHEALNDSINHSGNSKIFLSASRAQAYEFKTVIQNFASQVDVHLEGEVIKLQDGQQFHFLGTNSRTAQGRHGDLYIDEYFWIPKFTDLQDLAQPIMGQQRYHGTYFSAPSSKSHEAYPFWTGEAYNRGRPKKDHVNFNVDHFHLKNGVLCPDEQWRRIITIEDAVAEGCTLFDIEQLRREYTPEKFLQRFMCEFIDDSNSVFPMEVLQACGVDSWDVWADFYKPLAERPLGYAPVWISYDPTEGGDSAGLVVIRPPQRPGEKFLVIESLRLNGNNYQEQAGLIKSYLKKYNVEKIVIDATGLGSAVLQIVETFFPAVIGLKYTVDMKVMMVLKMQQVLRQKRFEFDAGSNDMTISFMGIKRTTTAKSKQTTYIAGRSEEAGHSDLAWATMQAIMQEPLDETIEQTSSMEIF